eukprot:340446-Rhodomonas_salina.2
MLVRQRYTVSYWRNGYSCTDMVRAGTAAAQRVPLPARALRDRKAPFHAPPGTPARTLKRDVDPDCQRPLCVDVL